jgi:hypothetical protein
MSAQHQIDHGGLAGARTPDQADFLPRLHRQLEAVEDNEAT